MPGVSVSWTTNLSLALERNNKKEFSALETLQFNTGSQSIQVISISLIGQVLSLKTFILIIEFGIGIQTLTDSYNWIL